MNIIDKLEFITSSKEQVIPVSVGFLNEILEEIRSPSWLPMYALEDAIRRFHNTKGTFNFHLKKFNILVWDFDLYEKIPPEMYEKMQPGDYVVEFIVVDNSFSQDVYYELLENII